MKINEQHQQKLCCEAYDNEEESILLIRTIFQSRPFGMMLFAMTAPALGENLRIGRQHVRGSGTSATMSNSRWQCKAVIEGESGQLRSSDFRVLASRCFPTGHIRQAPPSCSSWRGYGTP